MSRRPDEPSRTIPRIAYRVITTLGAWSISLLVATALDRFIAPHADVLLQVGLPLFVLVALPAGVTALVFWAGRAAKNPADLQLDLPEIDPADTGDPIRVPAERATTPQDPNPHHDAG